MHPLRRLDDGSHSHIQKHRQTPQDSPRPTRTENDTTLSSSQFVQSNSTLLPYIFPHLRYHKHLTPSPLIHQSLPTSPTQVHKCTPPPPSARTSDLSSAAPRSRANRAAPDSPSVRVAPSSPAQPVRS
ncbi:hypothetical protein EJ06DRAFT_307328 [Trichodelitschia bisporula]|uniref:Uncharacterized protein n=1 Tax=Trichodelitschia bisporula TaxID=703511 RepID=A0A6G1I352_9PEZI|nr:hypothetical protein EJ06DRAFT_307328 [Trichodelitschia bisporula]